ncbi:3527_t:CDS:2 [Gigaspora rosea]|nr:3527_t:CDS:2 [Gigaspora rosea]
MEEFFDFTAFNHNHNVIEEDEEVAIHSREPNISSDDWSIEDIMESLTNDLEYLSIDRQNLLDRAVLKAWVGCGISFELIDNPFIQDLFMRLNPACPQ